MSINNIQPIDSSSKPEHFADFYVDKIPIKGKLILAPMDGHSDLPFRSICRSLGSAISYSEFVNVDNLQGSKYESARAVKKLTFTKQERPMAFQIYGHNIDKVVQTAVHLQNTKAPDIIDINMGCYVRKISERGAGAGMLKYPERIYQLFNQLSSELDIPATGKIRLGWDDAAVDEKCYLDAALALEAGNGKLLAVHGRTRKQGYKGAANWDAIAEICAAVNNIPVVANGDVITVNDIDAIQQHTQCDGVMIGRGAIGNPWIFQYRNAADILFEEKLDIIFRHFQLNIDFYGYDLGVKTFRKHSSKYLGESENLIAIRHKILTATNAEDVKELYKQATQL